MIFIANLRLFIQPYITELLTIYVFLINQQKSVFFFLFFPHYVNHFFPALLHAIKQKKSTLYTRKTNQYSQNVKK